MTTECQLRGLRGGCLEETGYVVLAEHAPSRTLP